MCSEYYYCYYYFDRVNYLNGLFFFLLVMVIVMDIGFALLALMICDVDWMGLDVSLFVFDFDGICI